jgi:TonB family protein
MRTTIYVFLLAAVAGSTFVWAGPQDTPNVVKRVDPVYPAILKMAGIEGEVDLKVSLDAKGAIETVTVVKGTREEFSIAAKEAMKQWQFSPAMDQGKPVRSEIIVPFRFQLGPESYRSAHDGHDTLGQDAIAILRRGLTPALRPMIDPKAFIIIGSKRSGLLSLLEKQGDSATLVEGNDVAMGWSALKVNPSGDAAVLTFESKRPSQKSTRFHTISFMMENTRWVIQSWHVSK